MQYHIQDAPIDLPTFLGELRDFADIFRLTVGHLIPSNRKGNRVDWQTFRKEFRRWSNGGGTVEEAIGVYATLDLLKEFAIKPFMADLRKLLDLNRHVVAQLERLRRSTPLTVRGSVTDKGSETHVSTPINKYTRYTLKARLVTAYALIRFKIDNMPSYPAIMMDALGFDEMHRSVWQLTRLSFIIDYFINVGDWLNQFHGQFITLPYEVIEQGWSSKFESVCQVQTEFDSDGYLTEFWNENVSYRVVNGQVHYTSYQRVKEPLPEGAFSFMPQVRLPSLRQRVNLVELMYLFGDRFTD
jgi:hypothetical protein